MKPKTLCTMRLTPTAHHRLNFMQVQTALHNTPLDDMNEMMVEVCPRRQKRVAEVAGHGVRRVQSAECRMTLKVKGRPFRSSSVTYSPDGRSIISATAAWPAPTDLIIHVLDAESGELRATLEGHKSSVTSVAVSPDGRSIVSGS
eukprot:CAMPEP_0175957856 /NCGR_PEP_ID=MMETSP0108-20121206/33922_1 /TAXON_ID=195067 ORGANISM="Goniomonas pacifica, Strain CCMP1869" /NCGR_SAMPLE_ID=MMETSP0108 /ASSEMBLY_ACC=CAM_ASM_000204 /LENGTH=144 /DNA_ID=CAMNT_0017285141 /DNA_START=564 /DNA_END=996 /DNA_ORIENTATION=-